MVVAHEDGKDTGSRVAGSAAELLRAIARRNGVYCPRRFAQVRAELQALAR
eukprot:CAMPEP_0204441614 /NCGR_PEP_ID=MMETSP0470-20130426/85593_1 /ASSEMBLY_ACC=CAM_ASM_000385 /TAXON_ID=2969 /ORGANISM="Oxyrrhis marina" /LENGTH=50 /DNA_ID=CAMNT_0051440763 /DNA_START=24 /DNA_END=172 /DNA_ORIENTATION=-